MWTVTDVSPASTWSEGDTVPTAPVINTPVAAGNPTITGTGTNGNLVFVSKNGTLLAGSSIVAAGTWSKVVTVVALDTLVARQENGGLIGPQSNEVTVVA